jgi:hypothetical protein
VETDLAAATSAAGGGGDRGRGGGGQAGDLEARAQVKGAVGKKRRETRRACGFFTRRLEGAWRLVLAWSAMEVFWVGLHCAGLGRDDGLSGSLSIPQPPSARNARGCSSPHLAPTV